MSHSMRVDAVAYTKGHKEAVKWNGDLKNCPYGATKRELQSWWNAGFHDTKNGSVEINMVLTHD